MTAHSRLPVIAAAATGIQVGAALVASRYVIDQTTPETLAMLRYAIGFFCIAPVVLITSRSWFLRKDIIPVSLLGILQFAILVTLLNYALQFIPSARVALIFATFPLQTMLIAAVIGREALTWKKSLGVILTIIGIGFVLGEDLFQATEGTNQWVGAIAAGLSAFFGALCSVLYRPYLQRYPAQNVSALAMFASVIFLFIVSKWQGGLETIGQISFDGWLAVVFIGVSSGASFFAWLWALKHLSPVRVTMFLSLSPVTSAILGVAFLSEPISAYLIAAMGLVISGLILALKDRAAEALP